MTEPEDVDEDLFADLYDTADSDSRPVNKPTPTPVVTSSPQDKAPPTRNGQLTRTRTPSDAGSTAPATNPPAETQPFHETNGVHVLEAESAGVEPDTLASDPMGVADSNSIGIKEDGKMFIGGLNWETTDQSLKDYFSQFGEVSECTVMRDAATGRSRGFGFLTFRDPKTVNTVMVKEHFLDNKIIDPKRAIPRDEQERTAKIFVGGVSQEATELDFKEYFMQYGRVIDATLMMDKDTGRPRGFGFVTFDSEAAVDATLQGDLTILGKPIEVKKAQPRGNMREEEERDRRGRRGARDDRFRDEYPGNMHQGPNPGAQAIANGMSPQMAAQYWQRMQQFMTQFMAAAQSGAMANAGMGGMNPAMVQQMKQYQAMQQMQGGRPAEPQSANSMGEGRQGPAAVNPQMMQQMQMAAGSPAQGGGNLGAQGGQVPTGPAAGSGPNGPGRRSTPGYNAQDQLMFEQRKYEQQQARRATQDPHCQPGGPTSWEGMYDDVPQPSTGPGGGPRGGYRGGSHRGGRNGPPPAPAQSSAPANAPTGPKNAGVPGANYRGGGRGGHRNYHPYRR